MRQYLKEGDLVSAEVQNIFGDGALSLHTRSMKYGKLSQGFLLKVNPSLIRRQKNHFHNLPCGASMILGNNGYVWICPTLHEDTAGGFVQDLEVHKCHLNIYTTLLTKINSNFITESSNERPTYH